MASDASESEDVSAPAEADKKPAKGGKASKDQKDAKASGKKSVDVKIDVDGLLDRTIKLPVGGSRSCFSDGKKLWYRDGRGTQVFDFETGKFEQCSRRNDLLPSGRQEGSLDRQRQVDSRQLPVRESRRRRGNRP